MTRLYSDEHFPLKVTQHLRALGHDVLTAQEAGKADWTQNLHHTCEPPQRISFP